MHYPRSKKGFTLVEIIVAILVMSLVFGMTTMLAVSISGYNKDKTHITTCHEENIVFLSDGNVYFINGRQEELHLIR